MDGFNHLRFREESMEFGQEIDGVTPLEVVGKLVQLKRLETVVFEGEWRVVDIRNVLARMSKVAELAIVSH